MTGSDDIGAGAEQPPADAETTGLSACLLVILHEVETSLEVLLCTGEPNVIDLRRLPMAPGDLEKLKTALGQGEVSATVDTLSPTHIRETAIQGVWWVTHCNESKATVGEVIEITEVPELLSTQTEDIQDALQHLWLKIHKHVGEKQARALCAGLGDREQKLDRRSNHPAGECRDGRR